MHILKVVFALLSACVAFSTQDSLKVTVYYEALCPDSVRFIVKQLYPTYKELNSLFSVDLVPYGKAIQNKVDGRWKFECQHGPSECYGNKIQACALNQTMEFQDQLNFVNCLMDSSDPSKYGEQNVHPVLHSGGVKICVVDTTRLSYMWAVPHDMDLPCQAKCLIDLNSFLSLCSQKVNITWEPIRACTNSLYGDDLLAAMGDRTHSVEPQISFVPTVMLNDVYYDDLQWKSMKNFRAVVCKFLENPPLCS